ncbi:hypothetical protein EDD11_005429 [Mortierella claussenii]|nr:hypothetical protein EDD11_005429 [Mortierella claussenii]
MVRKSASSSTAYRASNEAPETPLTPRTPRTPFLHTSHLVSPSLPRSRAALKRAHSDDSDMDLDLTHSAFGGQSRRRACLPNANPTPSEILSMDLNTLALHRSNRLGHNGPGSIMSTPSAKLSDEGIEHLNLSLPFDRLRSSPRKSMATTASNNHGNNSSLESVHRYPTHASSLKNQTQTSNGSVGGCSSTATTPVKNRQALENSIMTPPSSVSSQRSSPLLGSPRSGTRQPFMTDEPNNLFLTKSPRAIRTPRRTRIAAIPSGRVGVGAGVGAGVGTGAAQPVTPIPMPASFGPSTASPAADLLSGSDMMEQGMLAMDATLESSGFYWDDEAAAMAAAATSPVGHGPVDEDVLETESVLSFDTEKENHTPKMPEDLANPFFVGESKRFSTRSHVKMDGSTTPTGPSMTSGTITRSKRLALGSISPWRWNTFADHATLASLLQGKGSKGLGFIDGISKSGYTVSEWVETYKGNSDVTTSATTASSSSALSSASTSASSSSVSSSASSSASSSFSTSSSVSSASSSSFPTTKTRSHVSSGSSTMLGPSLAGKGLTASTVSTIHKIPEDHPNSVETAERKQGPSAIVAKVTESVIQPNSMAFNRRAQQLAGRIAYWKHGTSHLISENDKQQWPGEWKFEVFEDPASPGAPSTSASSLSFMSSSGSSLHHGDGYNATPYTGKGKLTERQLSAKKMRLDVEVDMDRDASSPPPSPSHRAAYRTRQSVAAAAATRQQA